MSKILLVIYFFSLALSANSQTADFTYQTSSGVFCNPSSVQFTQTHTGSPTGFVWIFFGIDTSTNSVNPVITYSKAGSYTVRLIVIYARTTRVVTKTIVINPAVTKSIGYDRNYICRPGVINFKTSGAGNISAYDWDFGDGSGIETTAANNITHNYTAFGVYKVALKATAVSGCVGTDTDSITVQIPPIKVTATPLFGCVPANAAFKATVTVPRNSSVTNYSWNFGDGSPVTSTTSPNRNHIFTSPGSYSPVVTITTSEGCTSSDTLALVAYGTPPFNHKAYPVKTVICGSETALFVSTATNANSYSWNFGDGNAAIFKDTIAQHKYTTLGIKNVTVSPAYNVCGGIPITFQINVVGVIATYTYSNSCLDKKTFSFKNTSQGNLSSVTWDFGDGSPLVHTVNATHTFTSDSSVTRLTVIDNITGCIDTFSRTIYTANPSLVNPVVSICKNDSTTFSVANSYSNPLSTYTWLVAGKRIGPVSDSAITISATLLGNFTNYVVINNGAQYCLDTIRLNEKMLVRGPDLSFTALPSICLNDLYTVTNTSKPFIPADSVRVWYWNFGTGAVNDSVYQPGPYLYNNSGTHFVTLTGIDKNGCRDSLVKKIIVNRLPFLYVIPDLDTLCSGQADSLIAFHSDTLTWSPTNSLSCATCDSVIANPNQTTQYFVTAATTAGCSVTDTVLVKVFPPFVAVPFLSDPYICPNDTIQLNIDPPGKVIAWSPAAGLSNPNIYGPTVSPTQNTTYTAVLTDSAGCFTGSADINVHLKNPATVDAGPDKIYPYYSNFTISPLYSNNISSYSWTPGDLLNCNTCPNPGGLATVSNTFFIQVTSDSGCIGKDTITIFVECKDANLLMPTAFTPNGDGHNDYFFPLTRGIKSIIRFSVYNRYGKLVYEARNFTPNDKTFGWNGKISGMDQTTNVFVYYVEALCDVGQKLYKKGSVVLIR